MARVSGGAGVNWLAVFIIIVLLIAIGALVLAFLFPAQTSQFFAGLSNIHR
jgi:hypothetical protein